MSTWIWRHKLQFAAQAFLLDHQFLVRRHVFRHLVERGSQAPELRRSRSSSPRGRAMPKVAPDGSLRVATTQSFTDRTAVPLAGSCEVSFSDSTTLWSDDRGAWR